MLSGTYNPALVALSVLIGIAASYTALDLAGRVRSASGLARLAWLVTAAVAMGGGIWAMHFVGMLAYSVPGMAVAYDVGLTMLSLVIPVVATGIAFLVTSGARTGRVRLAWSGLFLGLGIVAMHYIGMSAMLMPARMEYDPAWVGVSVLIAVGAASVALRLSLTDSTARLRIAAAMAMGVAIAGMHYSAMVGLRFAPDSRLPMVGAAQGLGNLALALGVSASTFVILFLALVAAMFDRRFAVLAGREAEALRRNEERFRTLYTRTPLPLFSLDEARRVENVTDAWLDLLGYTREEVLGRPLTDFMAGDAGDDLHGSLRTIPAPGLEEAQGVECRFRTKGGRVREVIASCRIDRDDQGRFLRILGGLTDVTEWRHAEEALRQSQKLEAIGQLTGGMAHDFNNLLSVVLGNLELLRKRIPNEGRAVAYVENALEGARRGARLTQRMLAFARRQELKPKAVDVAELVHGLSELLRKSLGPAATLRTNFPEHLRPVFVDANQLELVLLNLAVNARDAMPDGGTLTVSAREQTIVADGEPSHRSGGDYVVITVSDTGIGMDAETLSRATEPFFTTKGVGKGTGLGLAMVQGLAGQSGGWFTLASEPGQGTTAELWLPAATVHTAPDQDHVSLRPVLRHQRVLTILVVDDDPLVLANTAAMLEDLGHTVVAAGSAAEALSLLQSGCAVDMVITDHAMPGMTGVQLAAAIRKEWDAMPILLVSGFAEIDDTRDLPRLPKPFEQHDLADAVGQIAGIETVAVDETQPS